MWRLIPSSGMAPTIITGDHVLVSRLPYWFGSPQRGDVVTFKAPRSASLDEKEFVKRVVALPGDTVGVVPTRAMVDGRVAAAFSSYDFTAPGSPGGGQPADFIHTDLRTAPPVLRNGQVVVLRDEDETLRIMATRALDVRVEASGVYNGRNRVLRRSGGADIGLDRDLTLVGGDRALAGAVITEDGSPRLVLVRGRKLTLEPAHLVLNGKPLYEPYTAEPPHYVMPPFKVPPRAYWVLGDNRNDSNDSHQWGPLEVSRILGRAEWIYWPPSRIGAVRRR